MKGWRTHEEQKTVSDNITLTAVKWIDTRSVCLLSSFLQASPLEKCKRFDKKKKTNVEINQPKCIKLYNKNMGGVELADQLIALNRISFCVRKYYHKLVFHLLDMSIANAWLLYRRDVKKLLLSINKQQSLLQFKIGIVDSLLKVGKYDYKKRGRKSDNEEKFQKKKKTSNATHPIPQKDIQLDNIGHLPAVSDNRKLCKLPGCKGKVNYFCIKCNVHLCCNNKQNCFLIFHT